MDALLAEIDALLASITDGWCTPAKARYLVDRILTEGLIHIVEIGVLTGRSLLPMAMAVRYLRRGGFVLGVDPYDIPHQVESVTLPDHISWAEDVPFERFYADTLQRIRALNLAPHCGVLRAAAEDVVGIIGELDLLHIDGCHSVLSSCRDVETWVPKVRAGGLVVLDDAEWSTVREARAMLRSFCGPPIHTEDGWEVYRR